MTHKVIITSPLPTHTLTLKGYKEGKLGAVPGASGPAPQGPFLRADDMPESKEESEVFAY